MGNICCKDKEQATIPKKKSNEEKKEESKQNKYEDHQKKRMSTTNIEPLDPLSLKCTADLLEGHENEVMQVVYITEDKLASISRDYKIKIWNTKSLSKPETLEGHEQTIYSITYLASYKYLATSDAANQIKLWDLEKMQEVLTIQECYKNSGYPKVIVAGKADEVIISGGSIEDSRILVFDWKQKKIEKELGVDSNRPTLLMKLLTEDIVAVAYFDEIQVWNYNEGSQIQTLKEHSDEITGIIGLANNLLLSSSEDQTIKLWDYNTGQSKYTNERHQKAISGMDQVDNEIIVSSSKDKEVIFWKLDEECNLTEVKSFNTGFDEERNIKSIVRVNGKRFATTNGDINLQLWK